MTGLGSAQAPTAEGLDVVLACLKRADPMNDLQKRIDELEIKAAESALIADLATDPEARIYNTRLAQELREYIARLRRELPQSVA